MTMKNEDDTEDKTHSAFFKKGIQNDRARIQTRARSVGFVPRDTLHRMVRRTENKVAGTDGSFAGTPPASIVTTLQRKTETQRKTSSPFLPGLITTGTQLPRSSVETENSQRILKFAQASSSCAERETKRSWTRNVEMVEQHQRSKKDEHSIKDDTATCSSAVVGTDKGSVHRYALYRSMLRSSQIAKMKAVESPKNDFRRPTNELLAPFHFDEEENTSRDEDTQSRLRSSQGRVHVESEPVPAEDLTSCDLRGTEFPKRIYIREVMNGAIVDELVDVRSRRDWEILTYMSPLRPLRPEKLYSKTSRDISFPDLKDFQIYYFAFPWK